MREFADDLRGSHDRALFGGQACQRFRELRIAVVLARIGCRQELFCCGEFGVELSPITLVGTPGLQ